MLTRSKVSDNDFLSASYPRLRELTGYSPEEWSRWFTGKASPRLSTLERVADELGFTLVELVALFEKRRAAVQASRTLVMEARKPND